ncbi:MAG: hypothetical protein EZS28_014574 [Streblomastix strix]|uniref:EF-hand domain-containing protein n=1 Tax=Streblomastix strix TaxID=222440 RepID=A0A5J4W5H0_9EUKA|nr:MAG: hypothetical protein EZS28_014574 [Streblomastix strix]
MSEIIVENDNLKTQFARVDADADGFITTAEVTSLFQALQPSISEIDIQNYIAKFQNPDRISIEDVILVYNVEKEVEKDTKEENTENKEQSENEERKGENSLDSDEKEVEEGLLGSLTAVKSITDWCPNAISVILKRLEGLQQQRENGTISVSKHVDELEETKQTLEMLVQRLQTARTSFAAEGDDVIGLSTAVEEGLKIDPNSQRLKRMQGLMQGVSTIRVKELEALDTWISLAEKVYSNVALQAQALSQVAIVASKQQQIKEKEGKGVKSNQSTLKSSTPKLSKSDIPQLIQLLKAKSASNRIISDVIPKLITIISDIEDDDGFIQLISESGIIEAVTTAAIVSKDSSKQTLILANKLLSLIASFGEEEKTEEEITIQSVKSLIALIHSPNIPLSKDGTASLCAIVASSEEVRNILLNTKCEPFFLTRVLNPQALLLNGNSDVQVHTKVNLLQIVDVMTKVDGMNLQCFAGLIKTLRTLKNSKPSSSTPQTQISEEKELIKLSKSILGLLLLEEVEEQDIMEDDNDQELKKVLEEKEKLNEKILTMEEELKILKEQSK